VDVWAVYLTGIGTLLLLFVPFIPGLGDIPRWIPLHRLIWRSWERPQPPADTSHPAGSAAVADSARVPEQGS
jgi:hypothetical protein